MTWPPGEDDHDNDHSEATMGTGIKATTMKVCNNDDEGMQRR
jgi:hypothetical protein